MPIKRNYYEVLSVAKDCDDDTLRSAYRKMALQYHPDRNPGNHVAEEKFKEAAEAYSVLSDPQKRAAYDRFGEEPSRVMPPRPPEPEKTDQRYRAFRKEANRICLRAEAIALFGSAAVAYLSIQQPVVHISPIPILAGSLISGSICMTMLCSIMSKMFEGSSLEEQTLNRYYKKFITQNPAGDEFKRYTQKAALELFAPVLVGKPFLKKIPFFSRSYTPR